ncbi:MAG: DNA adenine methylase [Planctomycetaceae bacterium]|jgi:adenine-specific DNA-methyltransferase|nr:DNA adenine methylase [Planctomycetaceae bacterium]
MNYIGSKFKLLNFVRDTIRSVAGEDLSQKVFCDLFAGTGIVGRTFKTETKKVIANDCEYYSYVLNKNYIENHIDIPDKKEYIDELNRLPFIEAGFVYQNYCLGGGSGRQYFSDHNGKKIDTIRQRIEKWKTTSRIGGSLYYFLLASLLESADKLANTASVYGAYLKHLKKSAQKDLVLEPANFDINDNVHQVYNEDSNELIKRIEGDILYLDPPYNSRQYGANYHMLNTIAKYDHFVPNGKTGLREYYKSAWCRQGQVESEFENLLKNAQFQYIFLSYNNEGLMPMDIIKRIMSKYGHYSLAVTDYQRFKADRDDHRNHKADKTEEFVHVLEMR